MLHKGLAPLLKTFFATRWWAFVAAIPSNVVVPGLCMDTVVKTTEGLMQDDQVAEHVGALSLLRVILAILQDGRTRDILTLRDAAENAS